jgi:hypothetical protein
MLSRRRIPVIPWMVPIAAFGAEVGWLCGADHTQEARW